MVQGRKRRSIRLPSYDYSSLGAYFVTLCAYNRACLFGDLEQDEVELSRYGRIVEEQWLLTPAIRAEVHLDAFVVRPNHLHAVIFIDDVNKRHPDPSVGVRGRAALRLRRRPGTPGSLIAGYKASVTRRINELRASPKAPVWQRNYYEHVIRNEGELLRVQEYIENNPSRWAEDAENPDNLKDR